MNEKVEQELVEFKREIERKYTLSKMNQQYIFPKTIKRYQPRIRPMEVRYSTYSDEAEEECSEEGREFGESLSAGRMPTEFHEAEGKQMTNDELDAWMGDLVVEEIDVLPQDVGNEKNEKVETENSLFGKNSGGKELNQLNEETYISNEDDIFRSSGCIQSTKKL